MPRPDFIHASGMTYHPASGHNPVATDSAAETLLSHAASRFPRTRPGQPDLVWIPADDRDVLDR